MTIYDTIFTRALEIMLLIFIGMNLLDYGIHLLIKLLHDLKSVRKRDNYIAEQDTTNF